MARAAPAGTRDRTRPVAAGGELVAGVVCWSPRRSRWRGRRWTRPGSSASTRAAGIPRSSPASRDSPACCPIALLDVWIVLALVAAALDRRWRLRAPVRHAPARARRRDAHGARGRLRSSTSLFLACWGLNYRRQPITERLDFDRARVTAAEVDAASRRAVAELNRLHQTAHADLRGDADAGGHAGAAGAGLCRRRSGRWARHGWRRRGARRSRCCRRSSGGRRWTGW